MLIARLFQIAEHSLRRVLGGTLTLVAAARTSLTSTPRHPNDPSALQRGKHDPLPSELLETPSIRARCCASLGSCISYLRSTSRSGNNNWKIATEESSIELGSNVACMYATHREKIRSAGQSLIFEAPALVRFESRVFVATLEMSESKETNLQGSGASGGEMFGCDEI